MINSFSSANILGNPKNELVSDKFIVFGKHLRKSKEWIGKW